MVKKSVGSSSLELRCPVGCGDASPILGNWACQMQLPCQEPHKTLPPTSPLMSYGISKSYRPYLYKASRAATSLHPLGPHLQQAHHHLSHRCLHQPPTWPPQLQVYPFQSNLHTTVRTNSVICFVCLNTLPWLSFACLISFSCTPQPAVPWGRHVLPLPFGVSYFLCLEYCLFLPPSSSH